ncbi:WD repeat and FYVE domain-containing protein 3 [Amphibalanus amphitrite]|uniref:WD repeat and FYVE domain-containing protein 3 n=1 Tax=Amphibalanus amphitrite TaxID=1232801 RepID=A0A6A4V5I8_AMPAM|nr:WD repeat and FYVE domain-containing protein 3 [Amphibalanus amphitrite]
MRKRTVSDVTFYQRYPYRPDLETVVQRGAAKYKVPVCRDARAWSQQPRRRSLLGRTEAGRTAAAVDTMSMTEEEGADCADIGEKLRQAGLRGSLRRRRLTSDPDEEPESLDLPDSATDGPAGGERQPSADVEDTSPDNQTLLRLLEHGEKISHMYRCARIQGLDTVEGLLLFGRDHVYVVDGFTMLKTREIRDIGNLPANMHDPIVPCQPTGRRVKDVRSVSKVAYDDIREVLKRRYLLQPIAVEFFSADGRNYLLAFPIKTRNKIYQRLQSVATSMADTQESVAGQKTSANVDQSGGLLSSLMGETSVTQRWVRGEMSNFQYLMHLNSLAGRSYNDLMQYPVFPWVLKDYSADKLDLTDPSTFRDLARPMGAQTPKRLHQFEKRYREWDDPTGETPPYHYGTHYSSAMIVCSYLVRLEPFSTHFLRLQGGHFDLADRMFHSVEDAWRSASEHNMADVRELIPEFFYLPEFLTNANQFDLGHKQNGTALDDVVLPAWAKGDPREFIRVHREALECPYVSSHLHHWIDLIFGCKQQGHGAVDAYNVFHYLFYEGNVDIFSIEDPLKKTATVGFINNFGQIPRQLFKKPHPQRRLVGSSLQSVRLTNRLLDGAWQQNISGSDKLFFHALDGLRPSMQPVKELKGPIGHIVPQERSVLAVEQNKYIVPGNSGRYVAWGFADHSIRVGSYETDRASLVAELVYSGEVLCCVAPRPKLIVTGGTSTVVVVYEYGKRRLQVKARLCGHTEAVLSLAASTAYSLIVSGSRDGTCIVWDLFRLTYVRQLRGHSAPVAAVAINDVTGDIATSSGTWLHVWTVNGAEVARVNTAVGASDRMQQILCLGFSQSNEWDAENVIMTGSTDGVVRMWSLDYVQVPVASPSPEASPDSNSSERSLPERLSVGPGQRRSSKADEIVRKMSLVSGDLSPQGGLSPSLSAAAAGGGGWVGLAGRCVALLPDALREDVRDVVEAVRRASLVAPAAGAALGAQRAAQGTDTGTVLLRSGSESSLSEGAEGSEDDIRSCGTGGSASKRSSRRPSMLRRQQAVSGASGGAHTVQLSAALEALASVSSCEEADQSPGPSSQHPPSVQSQSQSQSQSQGQTKGQALAAGKAHSLETAPEQTVVRRQKSEHNTQEARKSTGDRLMPPGVAAGAGGELRGSRSDTNLAAAEQGFVVVTAADLAPAADREKRKLLREGFRWQCQLVFRSKLTMHTAYDRRDNAEPASVTALAVSKDHRTVYVGDSRGRVWAWSVSDSTGPSDHWRRDDSALACALCGVRFSVTERKHHCRNCGDVFCAKCSHHESEIIRLRILKPVRVCQRCFDLLRPH